MSQTVIGAQMFTLRDFCQTPADIAASCAKIKKMGYGALQASAAGFNTIDANELKKILDGEGLLCAATHEGLMNMDDEAIKKCIEKHQVLDCKYTAIGGFFPKEAWTLKLWDEFVGKYNALAKQFAGSGVTIGYHNHSHEFAPVETGQIPLQILVDKLDKDIWFEIDTYWVAHGGGDPAAWIRKVAGRIPCVHVKDMTMSPDRTQKMCEVGAGNLNWPAVLDACREAGVEWYLVERDSGDLDPFESLKISLDNLRSWGLQ